MALRVFQLAKELGVKSAAIVEKCQAEGLDMIKNHMSTLSVGLSETIREWFSEGDLVSTIETSARVDLDKVKTRKRRRSTKSQSDEDQAETAAAEATMAVAEPPVEEEAPSDESDETVASKATTKTEKKKPKAEPPKRLSPQDKATLDEDPSGTAAAEEPKDNVLDAPPEDDTPEKPKKKPLRKPAAPPEPFVPKPATLQGPKVIRVERAEEIAPPPARAAQKKHPLSAADLDIGSKAPAGGPGSGAGKRHARYRGVDEEEKGKAGKRSRGRGSRHQNRVEVEEAARRGNWGDRDWAERQERLAQASGVKLHRRERRMAHEEKGGPTAGAPPRAIEKAEIAEPITVKELCSAIGVRSGEIIGKLMGMGIMATINQVVDKDAAAMLALDYGVELTVREKVLLLDQLQMQFDESVAEDDLEPRPPIVTFLGHVDHGKTSLLDHIRSAQVVTTEAGGITQHIGSYLYDDGKRRVTFLDTPGHKAFTAMRARGANMTDIVVLVVAADDGVMPQTLEAIDHAKAAGVPIVVAMNKIDLPNSDENKILGQLAEKELVPTAWGGDVEVVKTSAVTGEGISELVEYLDYVAELNHLKAKSSGPATGWVVEAEMTTGQGVVARLLVKQGTMKTGDILVSGCAYGRVRTIEDAASRTLDQAGPAMPIIITGLDEVPAAGDRFFVVDSMAQAKEVAEEQRSRQREQTLTHRRHVTLENLFTEIKAGELRELNVIIKADVQGSMDVLRKSVMELNTSEVAVRVLLAGVGGISESDVLLAEASDAIIIGFQVVADEHSKALAERLGVEIRLYRVIYQITDDITKALEGLLAPRIEQKSLGRAEVRQVFKVSRLGSIAGCAVIDGIIQRNARIRLVRDGVIVNDNLGIDSLKRVKDDVNEARKGLECGIKLAGFDDLKEGDILEAYQNVEVSRTLDSVE